MDKTDKIINDFLIDENKFVLHFYGDRNTGKTKKVRDSLEAICKPDIWTCSWIIPKYHQANTVLEHFSSVAQDFFLSGLGEDEKIEKTESLYRRVDNVKDISVMFRNLWDERLDERLKKQYPTRSNLVLIIDNAENIISFHKFLNLDSWHRHMVEQWQYFLKSLIELNAPPRKLKLIIISKEHILDWGVLDRYRQSWSIGSGNADGALNTQIAANVKTLVSICKSNPNVSDAPASQKNDFAACCELFHKERKDGHSYLLFKCLTENQYDVEVLKDVFLNIVKQAYFDFKSQILGKSNSKTEYSDGVESIKSLISFYFLLELIESCFPAEKAKGEISGADSGGEVRKEYFKRLAQMLCMPIRGNIFGDVADCLRRNGYEKILRDMLECIRGQESADISPVLLARIKILQGNLLFYPYPEDFLGALRCYADALKTAKDAKECAYKPHQCHICIHLVEYEIFNVLYQIRDRGLDKIWSERELAGFNGVMKTISGLCSVKTLDIKVIMLNLLGKLNGNKKFYRDINKHKKCWEALIDLNELHVNPEHRWAVARLKFDCLYPDDTSFSGGKLPKNDTLERALNEVGEDYWVFAKAFYHARVRLNRCKGLYDKDPEDFENLYNIFSPLLGSYSKSSSGVFGEQGERAWRKAKVDELLGDIMLEAISVESGKGGDVSGNRREDAHMGGRWKKAQEFKKRALEHYASAENTYAVLGNGYYAGRVRRKIASDLTMAGSSRRGTRSVPV